MSTNTPDDVRMTEFGDINNDYEAWYNWFESLDPEERQKVEDGYLGRVNGLPPKYGRGPDGKPLTREQAEALERNDDDG